MCDGDILIFQLEPKQFKGMSYFETNPSEQVPGVEDYLYADSAFEAWSYTLSVYCEDKWLGWKQNIVINAKWPIKYVRTLIAQKMDQPTDGIDLLYHVEANPDDSQDSGTQAQNDFIPITEYWAKKGLGRRNSKNRGNNPPTDMGDVHEKRVLDVYCTLAGPFCSATKLGSQARYYNVQWTRKPTIQNWRPKIYFRATRLLSDNAEKEQAVDISIYDYIKAKEVLQRLSVREDEHCERTIDRRLP
ncbi:uncharacterized protein LOC134853698 [Symsagittifera roscoffensis]|uniref:uncharacterized protein LOC134853698 n=1 Tax=Symsagittifera roscoffensis TaxID=84072 RepID=UPI00307C1C57